VRATGEPEGEVEEVEQVEEVDEVEKWKKVEKSDWVRVFPR
jgi:hypothetical protein